MTEGTIDVTLKPKPRKPWRWPFVRRARYEADLRYAAAAYKKRTQEATTLKVLWGLIPEKHRKRATAELERIRRKNQGKAAAVAK